MRFFYSRKNIKWFFNWNERMSEIKTHCKNYINKFKIQDELILIAFSI
jgi:hypothetical protein